MKYAFLVFLLLTSGAWGQSALGQSEELTLDAPWNQPVELLVSAASYRLEAADLGGSPVEVILERGEAGVWVKAATNRQPNGALGTVDWSANGERWRVRPVKTEPRTVVLRLKRTAFAELRDSLKQTLVPAAEVSLPLRKRLELPLSSTGSDLRSAGVPFEEPSDMPGRLNSVWGSFQFETDPFPRVWKSAPTGWTDLELPRNADLDRMVLGSTDDGVYALLGSSRTNQRAFYGWNNGWSALEPPPAEGPAGLWAMTSGAASLFLLEGQSTWLRLSSYDGQKWHTPLDLSPLAPQGAQSAVLLPPSSWSRTGTLVLMTDRIAVYDLP